MRRERFDRINIVPFVDIVLVLLVIVLATATFLKQGTIPIDLPEGNATTQPIQAPITLTIDVNGSYYYDDTPTSFDQLQSRLDTLDTNQTLLLRTDKQAPFGYFSRLVGYLKGRGFERVSIATQEVSGE
jgi:biopolymer transport protein ExbD